MVLTFAMLWDNSILALTVTHPRKLSMTGILAIDTATEACSVALWRDGQLDERHELAARQHSQRLFSMLRELLPDGKLSAQGIEAIAWGCGPGSFTGLRIAASAVQGLAFTNELPVVAVSTLACQAQTAHREGLLAEGECVLSTLDARIKEIYAAPYRIEQGIAVPLGAAVACGPGELALTDEADELLAIGSGCQFLAEFPGAVQNRIRRSYTELVPRARDLVPLALAQLRRGDVQVATEVQPVYVRDEINWKKIPEQGKRS
jgi:tRNA threonylcarbamoyladenosine biosynthesis protein TsaB